MKKIKNICDAVTTDGINTTGDSAITQTALMIAMAARFFEALPSPQPDGEEMDRRVLIMKNVRTSFAGHLRFLVRDEFIVEAGLAFYDTMVEAYEKMEIE